jgi:hypothetical protein
MMRQEIDRLQLNAGRGKKSSITSSPILGCPSVDDVLRRVTRDRSAVRINRCVSQSVPQYLGDSAVLSPPTECKNRRDNDNDDDAGQYGFQHNF